MQYTVFDPAPELLPFVQCFWTVEDTKITKSLQSLNYLVALGLPKLRE